MYVVSNTLGCYTLEKQIAPTIHLKDGLSLAHRNTTAILSRGSASSRQQEVAMGCFYPAQNDHYSRIGAPTEAARDEDHMLGLWQKADLNDLQKLVERHIEQKELV